MIITRLTGGLGNQMFQYAAGLALAEQHRTVLKLDVAWFRVHTAEAAHNRHAISCLNVTEQFATMDEVDRRRGVHLTRTERWSLTVARALRLRQYERSLTPVGRPHFQNGPRFDPGFFRLPDETYLDGLWQSESFFAPVANLLRLHFSFRYPPLPAVAAMAARIRHGPSAAVHFRRGDYLTHAAYSRDLGVLPLDYYHRAVALLRTRHPDATLYIFSDDIDAIEREFQPAGPHIFVRVTQPWHAYDKIRLMSLCDHAIVSNSTFAWWAAWLNPSPNKLVVAPDPWFGGKPDESRDVVPASWQRIATAS